MKRSILAFLGITSGVFAAQANSCAPTPPTACYLDDCKRSYCLGPENYGVNAPVCPRACNGDLEISASGFYWNAHQDGMEFAIQNNVRFPNFATVSPPFIPSSVLEINNIIDAEYLSPKSKWDFGFKLGLSYCIPCDGWDLGVEWTWFRTRASSHVQTEPSDNRVLLPLISALASSLGGAAYASDISADWKLEMNLIDLELGRNFWTSTYLALRPFMGIRIAYLNQDYDIAHRGGSFGGFTPLAGNQAPVNNYVDIDNDFHGVGLRGGLNSTWNLWCGWALFGNLAGSIVYGRFDVDHDETNRGALSPQNKTKVAKWSDSFRVSRSMLDLALGLQWMGMVCDCQYNLRIALGWEHHMFFDQNQMWRAYRVGDVSNATLPNNTGENVYHQRRGSLDTQGWTLTVDFSF